MRQAVRELEPAAPLSNVATVASLVDQSLLRPQSLSLLVASFAGVALLLSLIGIYGVMGYYVQQHLKEISIRVALGGSRADVARLVIGQGMAVVVMGVIAGAALAFAATRLMASLLFGVGAADPRTFTAVAALMLTVALWRALCRHGARCGSSLRRSFATTSPLSWGQAAKFSESLSSSLTPT